MRNLLILALLLCNSGVSVDALRADELPWIRDIEKASGQAQSEGKDLFILFTGHGWCAACEVLDRQVFRQQEFVQATAADYVFLELDFNFGGAPEDLQRKTTFMQLRSRFLAPAVPTIALADAQALPYGYITGYDADTGSVGILSKIHSARKAKERHDELKLKATSLTGVSKAETLSDALGCISPLLGTIDERGDDPLLQFYPDVIAEILSLTDGHGAVACSYISLKKRRDAWIASEAVFEKLKEFNGAKD